LPFTHKVAAIIDLLDVDSTAVAQSRAITLSILTGIIGLACAIVVAIDVASFIKTCRRAQSAAMKPRSKNAMSRAVKDGPGGGDLTIKVVGDD
jgi:hypothetical protein